MTLTSRRTSACDTVLGTDARRCDQRRCPGAGSTERAARAHLPVGGSHGPTSETSHEYAGTPSRTIVETSGMDSSGRGPRVERAESRLDQAQVEDPPEPSFVL